jgi:tungstate transport system substrate-binding protein
MCRHFFAIRAGMSEDSPMRSKSSPRRRALGITTALAAAIAVSVSAAPLASAADPTVTNVVLTGTTDVSDSGLFSQVIQPDFAAANPQYTVSYVPLGSGAAIANAEGGSADALIVHAASLENQFVGSGFSTEKYGRSIFWGDYVLLGPASDPAGVKANGAHDIAAAFKDVATAGAAGNAFFESRGGTPGTVVQEHAIWALTSGVPTCTVSDANGGGITPSTSSGPCGSTTPPLPAWYKQNSGASQATNVTAADTCAAGNGTNDCYVFTDRGTYEFMKSKNEINNLTILTQTNSARAPGGVSALVNSFHAYAVNPAAPAFKNNPNVHLNTAGAKALLDWMTSPDGQSQIGAFLQEGSVKTFVPSAAPNLTASNPPSFIDAGDSFNVVGGLSNVVPSSPALSGITISLESVPDATPDATPKVVATAKTTSSGTYSLTYKPTADAEYTVTSPAITKVENSTLSPVFGDLLQPTSVDLGDISVTAPAISVSSITVSKSYTATITVTFSPAATSSKDEVRLYGEYSPGPAGQKLRKTIKLKSGVTSETFTYSLSPVKHTWKTRTWTLKLAYLHSGAPTAVAPLQTVVLH